MALPEWEAGRREQAYAASPAPTQSDGRKPNPGVAAVLSLVIPGAGQMYQGRIGAGLLWLIFVVLGYAMFIVPGLILHLICIFKAARS